MEWITTAKELIALISAFVGLVIAGISAYGIIKTRIQSMKDKTKAEQWAMLQEIAIKVINEIEHSEIIGSVNKKQAAFDTIKNSCKAAGINVDEFMDQLSSFIDGMIAFHNGMNNKK